MTDKGIEGGSKSRSEKVWRKTGRTHSNESLVWEKVKVKIDPTNPENVPTMDELPPQEPPEVVREEKKRAQIDGWHKSTDT